MGYDKMFERACCGSVIGIKSGCSLSEFIKDSIDIHNFVDKLGYEIIKVDSESDEYIDRYTKTIYVESSTDRQSILKLLISSNFSNKRIVELNANSEKNLAGNILTDMVLKKFLEV